VPDDIDNLDSFPWCAVNPLNGRLYTGDYPGTRKLFAFDKDFDGGSLVRHEEDDITLSAPDREFLDIQGAVFTPGGKVLLVRGTSKHGDNGGG